MANASVAVQYEDKTEITYLAAKHPYWGRGKSPIEAVRNYRKAGGGGNGKPKVAEVTWTPYLGEEGDAYVDDFGAIRVPGKFVLGVGEIPASTIKWRSR